MKEEKVTFCRVCEALCGLVATVEDGRVTHLRPDPEHVVSKGYGCAKGLAFQNVTHDPDRVLHPMKKRDGKWERIDWTTVIAQVAGAPTATTYGRAVCGTYGTLTSWALDVLNIVTGRLDAPGGAIFADGALDMVAVTSRVGMDHYAHRHSRVGHHPACRGDLPSGILADEITIPGAERARALVVTAGNPVLSMPNGDGLGEAMKTLEIGVAIDLYMNETAARCDYSLPATTFLEREDIPLAHQNLMLEPYVQWTDAVIPPLGESRHEWRILSEIGEAMGLPFMNNPVLDRVRKLLRRLGRSLSATGVVDLMIRTGPCGDRVLPWRDRLSVAKIRAHPHGLRLPENRTGVLNVPTTAGCTTCRA